MTAAKAAEEGRCQDCPGMIERREADAAYRATVLTKMEGYDLTLPRIEVTLKDLSKITQENFNRIYFRMGVISGGTGLASGIIGTLVTLHLGE
jgi:ribosomal protein S3AE